jgi:hypothetical protein
MIKTLKVVEPVFNLSTGDVLELSEDGSKYVYEVNENSSNSFDDGSTHDVSFSSTVSISPEYAMELINDGILENGLQQKTNEDFKNVFSEIDAMIEGYNDQLDRLDDDFKDKPACMKVEKQTVLSNLVKVLIHLRNLKK